MDYDKLAHKCWADIRGWRLGNQLELIVAIIRWYDACREKETCEWIWDSDRGKFRASCTLNKIVSFHFSEAFRFHDISYCPYCGRRIVEKEAL